MTKANIMMPGRASSALGDSHIKWSRYAHQVSVAPFSILRNEAYFKYCLKIQYKGPNGTFEKRSSRQEENYPTFFYWSFLIDFQLLLLWFIRSLAAGDFELYVQACDELRDYFLAPDHPNYSRFLPVHVKDMVQLQEKHSEVYLEFMVSNFVV